MELEILNFDSKEAVRLNTTIDKIVEKCIQFYKKMCSTHNKCQVLVGTQDQDFPTREHHLNNL